MSTKKLTFYVDIKFLEKSMIVSEIESQLYLS